MSRYTFTQANGNGQSQCQKCGAINWDIFMWKVKEFDNHRVCSNCKKHMENGTEEQITLLWIGFTPKY